MTTKDSTEQIDREDSGDRLFVTVERAAYLMDCSKDTVRRMIARGELRARRMGPRLLRIEADSIREAGVPIRSMRSEW
jgi:excisionase family DNA binding protein